MKRYSLEEKLAVVNRLLSGESLSSISRKTGIKGDIIGLWRLRYEKYGLKGLDYLPRNVIHPMEKRLAVVRDYHEGKLTLLQIANEYDIPRQTINRWVKLYSSRSQHRRKHRRKQRDVDIVDINDIIHIIMKKANKEDISSELSFLKDPALSEKEKMKMLKRKYILACAERDYLKKLEALMRAKETQYSNWSKSRSKTRSKPSNH